MSSMLLLEAIGYLDEDLLERSEKKQERKKNAWIRWGMLAACVCLVCVCAWGILNPVKSNDSVEQNTEYPADTKPAWDMRDPGDMEQYADDVMGDILRGDVTVHFFRADSASGEDISTATAISSRAQLEEYMDEQKEFLRYSDFNEVYGNYDEMFFREKQLIILELDGNSGSVSHEFLDITEEENGWKIRIQRFYPAQLTKDLVYWRVLVELDAGTIHKKDAIAVEYFDISEDN